MHPDLRGKVAVVTGGGSGIGRATAVRLARCGARVVVGDVREHDGSPEWEPSGIESHSCDVRRERDVERLITSAACGEGIDILVHSAGIVMVGQVPETSAESWDACLDTNLKGAFLTAKHGIPWMRRRGGGAIVQIASNAGLLPRAHDPVYSTSKGALLALTRSLALSHSIDRIRVNAVCPGPVAGTRIINEEVEASPDPTATIRRIIDASPLCRAWGRMVTCQEVAELVLFLVSDAALMITGTAVAIDGGKSLGVPPVTPTPTTR